MNGLKMREKSVSCEDENKYFLNKEIQRVKKSVENC